MASIGMEQLDGGGRLSSEKIEYSVYYTVGNTIGMAVEQELGGTPAASRLSFSGMSATLRG